MSCLEDYLRPWYAPFISASTLPETKTDPPKTMCGCRCGRVKTTAATNGKLKKNSHTCNLPTPLNAFVNVQLLNQLIPRLFNWEMNATTKTKTTFSVWPLSMLPASHLAVTNARVPCLGFANRSISSGTEVDCRGKGRNSRFSSDDQFYITPIPSPAVRLVSEQSWRFCVNNSWRC